MKKGSLSLLRGLALLVLVALLAAFAEAAKQRAAASMTDAAGRFLAALDAAQREKAAFAFDDAERLDWHFIPRPRRGIPLKELGPEQRALAAALLKTGLSQTGYAKATTIMELEAVLGALEAKARAERPTPGAAAPIVRDPDLYYFTVFGTPSPEKPWGWRVEGHHVSLNFTVVKGDAVATTPSFLGVNPARVPEGGPRAGLRVLAQEEDQARALVLALDAEQRALAVFGQSAPRDIITMNKNRIEPLTPAGLSAGRMTAAQQNRLRALLALYADAMPAELAAARIRKIQRAGFERVHFAWAGATEPGRPHYYRVQGPTFLIEYDDTQNDANHIHSVWRDWNGDFGQDLLRDHYASTPHD
jgi:hypothetical protein